VIPFANLLGGSKINTAAPGQAVFTSRGNQQWTVPSGVYEVSVLAVGAGASGSYRTGTDNGTGGGGGDVRWINRLRVQPGEVLDITIPAAATTNGARGGSTTLLRSAAVLLRASGGLGLIGTQAAKDSTTIGAHPLFPDLTVGGGNGGAGAGSNNTGIVGGAGGAGGYSGNGSAGGGPGVTTAAGSGGSGSGSQAVTGGTASGNGAGGVGLFGEGASGAAASTGTGVGKGGSGGADGTSSLSGISGEDNGAIYGAGGQGFSGLNPFFGLGGLGALRILWGQGPNNGGRAFPATNVATATS